MRSNKQKEQNMIKLFGQDKKKNTNNQNVMVSPKLVALCPSAGTFLKLLVFLRLILGMEVTTPMMEMFLMKYLVEH